MFKARCLRTLYLKSTTVRAHIHSVGEKKNLNLWFALSVKIIKTTSIFVVFLFFFFLKKKQISCYEKPESFFHQETVNCIQNYS